MSKDGLVPLSSKVTRRDQICTGTLIKPAKYPEDYGYGFKKVTGVGIPYFTQEEYGHVFYYHVPCREMLFTIDGNQARDLIYTTPTIYPVLGTDIKFDYKNLHSVADAYYLDEILKYLKYDLELSQRDLVRIFNTLIINGKWRKFYQEIFGEEPRELIIPPKNGKPHKSEPNRAIIRKRRG